MNLMKDVKLIACLLGFVLCLTGLNAQETYSQRPLPWVARLQTKPAETKEPELKPKKTQKVNSLNPATFISIFEDRRGGGRVVMYTPTAETISQRFQGSSDETSSIIVVPDPDKLGEDIPLNKLYITARLASGDSSKEVTVTGYSEIGKDQATMAAQGGAAFQSAKNIQAMVLNMAYTVDDIINGVYYNCRPHESVQTVLTAAKWQEAMQDVNFRSDCARQIDESISQAVRTPGAPNVDLQHLQDRFRLFQPEVQAISDFFTQPKNLAITEKIGTAVFWIDRDSLERIAEQYKNSLTAAYDPKSSPETQARALQDLLERTKLVYRDFGDFRRQILAGMELERQEGTSRTVGEWRVLYQDAITKFADKMRKKTFDDLKKLLAPGIISLTDNKAKDGDRLTVTVESMSSDGSTGGISAVFEIAIKKYGGKLQWGPSLLFVRRLAVTDAEAAPPAASTAAPINRVNFAPSPGVTFGWAYFKRGETGWSKFARGLGPGVGMNVSFMNFNDPSFDLSTQKFVSTNGTNVQVGAGVVGSLFDNKLQVSYGWNLNVEQRRTYFGVGFGFIEVGKEVAKYIAK